MSLDAVRSLLLAPSRQVTEDATRFLKSLAVAVRLMPAPCVSWTDTFHDGPATLWDEYRAMSAPLQRAFRSGWASFVAWLPPDTRPLTDEIAALLAEPEGAAYLDGLLESAPWHDPKAAGLTGKELILYGRRRDARRRSARRRKRGPGVPRAGQDRAATGDVGATAPAADPVAAPRADTPAVKRSETTSARVLRGSTLTLGKVARLLAEAGEEKRSGEPITRDALRARLRNPDSAPSEYAELARLKHPANGRFPKAEVLALIERVAKRVRAEQQQARRTARLIRRTKTATVAGASARPATHDRARFGSDAHRDD